MPTLTTDTLCTVLWGLAATAVAWVCLPNVMQLLGQTRFESETDEGSHCNILAPISLRPISVTASKRPG